MRTAPRGTAAGFDTGAVAAFAQSLTASRLSTVNRCPGASYIMYLVVSIAGECRRGRAAAEKGRGMTVGKRGQLAQVKLTFATAEERAHTLPGDTRATPYCGWIKGVLVDDAAIGEAATVETVTGRHVKGTLERLQPSYDHTFGPPHKSLLSVGRELRELVFEKQRAGPDAAGAKEPK